MISPTLTQLQNKKHDRKGRNPALLLKYSLVHNCCFNYSEQSKFKFFCC